MSAHAGTAFGADLVRRLGEAAAAPQDLLARVGADEGGKAFAGVFAPDSADGVAEVLGACSAEAWPVIPLGAATWWHPARAAVMATAAGDRPPVLLSTIRLNRITEHVPADLVVGVQAGLALERLGVALAEQRQWLPLDPPAAPPATIGATAALGGAGPLRAAHGTPRDMALGIEIATGDGRLLRFGGRVVKNVAGYDGVRLAVGSRGTIGVITSIYLRVRGAPRADRTLGVACGPGQDGARRGAELALAIRSAAACDAIELVSPAVARRIGGSSLNAEWTLLIRLLGSEAAVVEGVERATAVSRHAAVGTADLPADVWRGLARLEAGARAALRLSGSASGLAAGIALAESLTGGSGGEAPGGEEWRIAAHAADGIVRLWHPAPPTAAGDLQEFLHRPDDLLTSGWTVRYERIDPTRTAPSARLYGEAAEPEQVKAVAELTARIRAAFDPAGILRGEAW